jgi:two-component system chemotaxis response regulator CheB
MVTGVRRREPAVPRPAAGCRRRPRRVHGRARGALRAVIPALAEAAARSSSSSTSTRLTLSFAEWLEHATGVPSVLAETASGRGRDGVRRAAALHLRLAPRTCSRWTPSRRSSRARRATSSCGRSRAHAGSAAVGVVLTGMGDDGARGLLEIRRQGGTTFARTPTPPRWTGCPARPRELGGASAVLPLADLGHAIAEAVRRMAA